tara:strand:+ start:505 stop:1833 length:1329 start_codon:yes stop_codon:yes gene_type:complete
MKKIIDANPTKEFFISILVRDINIMDAIGDLVDNCIDGAKRLRGEANYSGLEIQINISPDSFTISDNCGGIPINTAEKYAFRFGRPSEMEATDFSIGQFGIGMKRALFKLGNNFMVSSSTLTDYFSMSVDVNGWKNKNEWTFDFERNGEHVVDVSETGTNINVTSLHDQTKSAFSESSFIQELYNQLELDHMYNINKGLKIYFNGNLLKSKILNLRVSDSLKVGVWEKDFPNGVSVKLIVGVGPQDEQAGGWYIFCNDRLIVGPDTSKMTGWTGKMGDGVANYHHQYRRFRGFAFFNAEDSSNLPWNTTKTGMNTDSPVYKAVRQQMIVMMKVVINGFLNYLKKERESGYTGNQVLHSALKDTNSINIANTEKLSAYYSQDKSFNYPTPDKSSSVVAPGETTIKFRADKEDVKKVKKFFNVTTNPEVGLKSFQYVIDNEIDF